MEAIEAGNIVESSHCASEILRLATGIEYDVTRIVEAIKARDYDTLYAEALALKSFIIRKLNERR